MIEMAPVGYITPTIHSQADAAFRIESLRWFRPPFRSYTPAQAAAENRSREHWAVQFIARGELPYPATIDDKFLARFEHKYARYHVLTEAYRAAWLARNAREPDAGHAPEAIGAYIDKALWTATDTAINTRSLILAAEQRHRTKHKIIERDSGEHLRALDIKDPIETPEGVRLIRRVAYNADHELIIEAVQVNTPPPLGPNGRPTVRTLAFTDDLLPYYAYIEEGSPPQRFWSIDWPENPDRPTPRESMRPFLEGTPNEHFLAMYSDEKIIYTPWDEEAS